MLFLWLMLYDFVMFLLFLPSFRYYSIIEPLYFISFVSNLIFIPKILHGVTLTPPSAPGFCAPSRSRHGTSAWTSTPTGWYEQHHCVFLSFSLEAWRHQVFLASHVQANLLYQWMPSCCPWKGGVRCIISEMQWGEICKLFLVIWWVEPGTTVRTAHTSHTTIRWGRRPQHFLIYSTANINNVLHTFLRKEKFRTNSASKNTLGSKCEPAS